MSGSGGKFSGKGARRVAAGITLVLAAAAGACAVRTAGGAAFPELAKFAGREVTDVAFQGNDPFDADTLEDLIETHPSRCNLLGLPLCIPGTGIGREEHHLDLETLRRDVVRLTGFYHRRGFFGTDVHPAVKPIEGEEVAVTFFIDRGDAIVLDTLILEGTEGVIEPAELLERLPSSPGERFDLGEFSASRDSVLRELRDRGHAYAEVLRSFEADTRANRATARLTAVPGPRVVVDSIIVAGAENLGRGSALRQLSFGSGDLLRARDLLESQRNLYSLELVQFATVAVAPDSLQRAPADSSTATVLVRIGEAPVHQVEAGVGFGTVDCFRADARWVNRSFGGGARRLALTSAVSKLGIDNRGGLGLGKSICSAFEGDTLSNMLDYRVTADLTQPWFLSPRNHLTVSAYAERQSEPNVFNRVAQGSRLALSRRLAPRQLLTASLDVERGRTVAAPALFCTALQVCRSDDIRAFTTPRWGNTLGLSLVRDRTDRALDPTSGHLLRTGVAWAAPWLLSDVDFVRWTGEAALYRQVRPSWVAAFSLRLGSFFRSAELAIGGGDLLLPEDRFYAGGATSVRGFDRNALGPGVYLADDVVTDTATGEPGPVGARFIPTGGTAVVVANAELRLPSPFAAEHLRLALFVDGGAVGAGELVQLDAGDWRLTPGAGLRLQTPVGPARLDVAYNPYRPTAGPVFVPDPSTGDLIRRLEDFRPEGGGFLSRLRVHLAVGQAF